VVVSKKNLGDHNLEDVYFRGAQNMGEGGGKGGKFLFVSKERKGKTKAEQQKNARNEKNSTLDCELAIISFILHSTATSMV